jgi:hypothetical protein
VLSLGRLALPVLLAVGAPTLLAAPAAADVTGTTASDDVVLYDHCQQHEVSYRVQVSPGTLLWRLELQLLDPAGHTSEGTVVNSATNPATSGTVPVTFCGSEPTGTYTVRATGFYELLPAVQLPFALPETTFEVRPVGTRTRAARKELGRGRYRLTARVEEQTERGFARADGVAVRIERLVRGEWRKVRGTTVTTVRGRATTTLTGRPGDRLRAVVPARHSYAASASRPLTL